LEISYKSGACHIGSALSCVEILVGLYWKKLKKNDIFIFGKASGASALYAVLAERGVIKKSKLVGYLKNYPLASTEVPGVVHSVGSLGHALPVAVGMALANRKRNVYVLLGDADIQEGTFWECLSFIRQHKIRNLVILIDRNRIQACGWVEDILDNYNLESKVNSFGVSCDGANGHDLFQIGEAFDRVAKDQKQIDKCPWANGYLNCISFNTTKGMGVDFMASDYEWHYRNLDLQHYANALLQVMGKKTKLV
jgi:transketolase